MAKLSIVFGYAVAAFAAPLVGQSKLLLTVEQLADHPTSVNIIIANLGTLPTRIAIADPGAILKISVQAENGREPLITEAGEVLRNGGDFGGRAAFREIAPGGSSIQPVDLRHFWVLEPGTYHVSVNRPPMRWEKSENMEARTTLTVPRGFVWDRGCTAESRLARAPNRDRAKLASNPGSEPPIRGLLSRQFRYASTQPENGILRSFAALTNAAKIPGGLALRAGSGALLVCLEDGMNVKQALEELRSARPQLSLAGNSSALNLIDNGISDFLETVIAKLTITHPVSDIVDAFESVFASPEMKQRAAALVMKNHTPAIFTRPPADPSEQPLYLEHVSAREALNAIAERWGSGAWIYTESDFGDKKIFVIEQYFKRK